MAQTITHADLTVINTGVNQVVCRVTMPASEYAAFIVTAGLTNAVPAAVTTYIAARVAAGASSGG